MWLSIDYCIDNTRFRKDRQVITVRLRQAIARYEKLHDTRLTYEILANMTGLSRATIEAVGSRSDYNPTLETIDLICTALECCPSFLLEYSGAQKDQVVE